MKCHLSPKSWSRRATAKLESLRQSDVRYESLDVVPVATRDSPSRARSTAACICSTSAHKRADADAARIATAPAPGTARDCRSPRCKSRAWGSGCKSSPPNVSSPSRIAADGNCSLVRDGAGKAEALVVGEEVSLAAQNLLGNDRAADRTAEAVVVVTRVRECR